MRGIRGDVDGFAEVIIDYSIEISAQERSSRFPTWEFVTRRLPLLEAKQIDGSIWQRHAGGGRDTARVQRLLRDDFRLRVGSRCFFLPPRRIWPIRRF